ncbi:DUF3798 domain-containing protein [Alkaliphilus serpentinus]|uniref:DUF3798 domain-containing protein n=1 Tax=Alkaliphilus serpentinus TaxID=1482731 RepID=A0A833M8A0_9FIRM|nr:DUF3798 domain-containing protein [Alkaliphilus serpentinus]KAB3530438.1 DUF3798 domain-containing protein [Alkaliphilus serpentinus]
MLKKLIAVLLVLVLVLGMAACSKPAEETPATGGEAAESPADAPEKSAYKIGIMTGTVSQGEEEFRLAQKMKEKYGDMIITATYPDKFMQEQETTITNMMAMASDPDVKAIVMVQAVPGAAAAIDRVREIRPDIFFFLGVPGEDPDMIASKGDIILQTNDLARGPQIAQHAKEMGAKVLVHYSFPRHMSYEMLAKRRDMMKEEAEKIGLIFVEADAPDPTGDAGVPGTQQFILEDLPRKVDEYGKDTAFFGTNCAMMEPMIRSTIEEGAIFPVQCCPSPYHALPAALGVSIPDDKKGDIDFIRTELENKIKAADAGGRVATWPVPVNMMYIEAGVEYVRAYLDGNTTDKVDQAKLVEILEDIAGGKVQLSNYGDYNNYFLYLSDHIIF